MNVYKSEYNYDTQRITVFKRTAFWRPWVELANARRPSRSLAELWAYKVIDQDVKVGKVATVYYDEHGGTDYSY